MIVLPAEKTCTKCNVLKPISSYNLYQSGRKAGRASSDCKTCQSERAKAYRALNRNKVKNPPSHKICGVCNLDKPIDEFGNWASKPDGKNSRCKACVNTYTKSYKLDPVNREKAISSTIASTLGVSVDEILSLRAIQKCQCCGNASDRILEVDHDHQTGKIRGAICKKCNVALGWMGDTIESLRMYMRYLEGAND